MIITSVAARVARDYLELRQAEWERSPTDANRKAMKAAERVFRAALRAQVPR